MNIPCTTASPIPASKSDLVETLLTTEDMLAILKISRRTLDSYLADQVIPPPFKIGRRLYWHREQIERWLRQQARL
ncbi:helix-turn-helix transcriptional regulator [Craterilacuibacter sinensis]|nr:helix-turn-helix domain-containing protein [Craterilacuibacter sinensis]